MPVRVLIKFPVVFTSFNKSIAGKFYLGLMVNQDAVWKAFPVSLAFSVTLSPL
jgi:hypothetical protein